MKVNHNIFYLNQNDYLAPSSNSDSSHRVEQLRHCLPQDFPGWHGPDPYLAPDTVVPNIGLIDVHFVHF